MSVSPEIVVVGIHARVPGANDALGVLDLACSGRDNARSFPAARLRDASTGTRPDDHHRGGYFDRIDRFDRRRFRLSARAAESMDPYQRACLVSAVAAVADAGLDGALAGTRTGVYGSCNGVQQSVYERLQREHGRLPDLMGTLAPSVAARISHHLDLTGPALMVDSACSSSLVALATACADLASGTVDVAIVTTANLYVVPGHRGSVAVDVVSERSTTRAFDLSADGASVGEGVVSVVLRRAADGTGPVYGTIRSWAVNQDGRTASMSAPNPRMQVDVVDRAWAAADVDPSTIALYVAHGTGTSVGDMIEIEGICEAGAFEDVRRQSVPLIAPKATFGHLDAASGLLSLCLALCAAVSGRVPAHPAFVAPLLGADLVGSPFYLPTTPGTIEPGGTVGVSAFGMTGTNVHVVAQGGDRALRRDAVAEPGERHWFSPERNTFRKDPTPALESFGVAVKTFALETHRDWEISEHRVQGVPMLVGTCVLEIASELLSGSPRHLGRTELSGLRLHRPLVGDGDLVDVTAAVETSTGRGEVRSRAAGGPWSTWATFTVEERAACEALDEQPPSTEGMSAVPVSTVVGDDESVSVSDRWSVVRSIDVSSDGTRGVARLGPPPGRAHEFASYAFYPSLVDAALNALNQVFCDGELLLPWTCERIVVFGSSLEGEDFTSSYRSRGTTRDERGNVVLTIDVDLWAGDTRVLSVRGYRVKNRTTALQDIVLRRPVSVATQPPARAPRAVTVWSGPVEDPRSFVGGVVDVDASGLTGPDPTASPEVVLVHMPVPGETVAAGCHRLGTAMLRLNDGARVDHVTVVLPGALGVATPTDPRARAAAAVALSLQNEFSYEVAVVDAPADPSSVETLRGRRFSGLSGMTAAGHASAIRHGEVAARPRPGAGFPARRVLVLGGSTGIGHRYAEHLATTSPTTDVVVAARRVRPDTLSERVEYVRADVTVRADVDHLAAVLRAGVPLEETVVVDFVGQASGGLFVTRTPDDFDRSMKSKVEGVHHVLDALGTTREIVLVTSVAGWTGALGQSDYAAANAYQSALVRPETDPAGRPHARVRCLALGGWGEVGMAAGLDDAVFERVPTTTGIAEIDAFVRSDLDEASAFRLKAGGESYSETLLAPSTVAGRHHRPSPVRSGQTASRSTGERVTDAWQRVLGTESYDHDVSFFDYGGDSISIVDLHAVLDTDFPGVFDVTTLFSTSTIRQQAQLVDRRLAAPPALPERPTGPVRSDQTVDIDDIRRFMQTSKGTP